MTRYKWMWAAAAVLCGAVMRSGFARFRIALLLVTLAEPQQRLGCHRAIAFGCRQRLLITFDSRFQVAVNQFLLRRSLQQALGGIRLLALFGGARPAQ